MYDGLPIEERQLRAMLGQWVCAVKRDGTYACGQIVRVRQGRLTLRGYSGNVRLSSDPARARAQISVFGAGGFGNLLGSGFPFGGMGAMANSGGGLGALGGFGRGAGFLGRGAGMAGRSGNLLSMGFGALKFLFPLISFFF